MKIELKSMFKIMFLMGLILLFTSMFLDWYNFQIFSKNGTLLASWAYNPFTGWYTDIRGKFNKIMEPKDLGGTLSQVGICLIVLCVFCTFGTLLKGLDQTEDIQKLRIYSYANLFVLILNGFFIFGYPVFYLFSKELYFPFMMYEDSAFGGRFYYSVGLGYYLQAVGFILIFPYVIFYYRTLEKFESEKQAPKHIVNRFIKKAQDPVDLDKLIAQEELKLKFKDLDVEEIIEG